MVMIDSQRRLPHWVPDSVPVFVTWRLAGTLPRLVHQQITAGARFAEADSALERSAWGPVWLKDPRVAQMVVEALHYGASAKGFYDLHAYVVMPNHVHVVWLPKAEMPRILRWLKGVTAGRARRLLGLTGKPFWQAESYDHWIRSDAELQKIIRYVERNPVKAGLVDCIEAWPWSSAQTARPSAPPAPPAPLPPTLAQG